MKKHIDQGTEEGVAQEELPLAVTLSPYFVTCLGVLKKTCYLGLNVRK